MLTLYRNPKLLRFGGAGHKPPNTQGFWGTRSAEDPWALILPRPLTGYCPGRGVKIASVSGYPEGFNLRSTHVQ